MPLTTRRTPFDLTINLATPGQPITYREQVQLVLVEGGGETLVGPPAIEGGELRDLTMLPAVLADSVTRVTAAERALAAEQDRAAALQQQVDRLASQAAQAAALQAQIDDLTARLEAANNRPAPSPAPVMEPIV